MLNMILANWLLAAAPSPVNASLVLQPVDNQRVELRLCFQGSGQRVRYRLKVQSRGRAGTAQSGQGGALVAGTTQQCPLVNRVGVAADSQLNAELHWWVDDVEQPVLQRVWPAGDAKDPPEPPATPPGPNEVVA